MLEVVTAYFIDTFGVNRKKATIILAIIMGLIGIVSALSFGPLADFKIFGNNFFDFLSVITDKFLMPLGGIFTCIFVGHIYKTSQLEDEIATGTKSGTFKMKKVFNFLISWICPILLIIIFLSQLF
jgi:NSS family neurotransmitter:Na+ symporter